MGLPLSDYLNENNRVIYPVGCKYPTLWPKDTQLLKEIQDQIISRFYVSLVYTNPPQYWLSQWWALVDRRAIAWNALLASETALRADDAIYNYDMVEERSYNRDDVNNTVSTTAGETTTSSGTNTTSRSYESDTPDGSIADIENYMSSGAESKSEGTADGTEKGSTKTITDGNLTTTDHYKLTRKGNIGVMTSAQIVGGYRAATKYSAYDTIFSDCEPYFIGVFEEDYNGYLYPSN